MYKPFVMNGATPTNGGQNIGTNGLCEETGCGFKVGGPFWIAPIHDLEFVDEAVRRVENYKKYGQPHDPLPTSPRLHGMLTAVSEELSEVPLYYSLPDLAHTVRCSVPPRATFLAALEGLGYRASATHKESDAIKTDAPNKVVWDLMRNWVRCNPVEKTSDKSKAAKDAKKKKAKEAKAAKEGAVVEEEKERGPTSGEKILSVQPDFVEDFKKTKSDTYSGRKKAARYPMNPEANWGPKALAGVNLEKRQVKQDKKKRERDEEKRIRDEKFKEAKISKTE